MEFQKIKQLLKPGFFSISIGNLSYTLSSFAITVLIARKLGSEEFGIYALGVAISGLIWRFFIVGPTSILGREVARVLEKGLLTFRMFLLFELLLIPIGILSGFVYSLVAGYPKRIIMCIILISIAKAFEYLQDTIRYYLLGKMKEIAFGTTLFLRAIIIFISVSIPLYLGSHIEGVVLCQIFGSIGLFLLLYQWFTPGFGFLLNYKSLKWMVTESFPLSVSGVLSILFSRIDILMLSIMAEVKEVGLYNVALTIPVALEIIPSTLASQMFPRLSALYIKSNSESYRLIKRFVFGVLLFGLILSFVIFLVGKKAILLLYGKEYQEATFALIILGFGFVFRFMTCITGTAMTAMNLQRYGIPIYSIAVLSNAIGNYLLIPKFSHVGCAISTSFSFFLLFLMSLIVIHKPFATKVIEKREVKEKSLNGGCKP